MQQPMGTRVPVAVMKASTKRETGKKAQATNIMAAKVNLLLPTRLIPLFVQAVADIIRTTLGPRAMLKMILDASGGLSFSSKRSIEL